MNGRVAVSTFLLVHVALPFCSVDFIFENIENNANRQLLCLIRAHVASH